MTAEAELARAEDEHKKQTEVFDRFVKLAAQKQWRLGDRFRQLPVLDAFASPIKIQQYTLDELPIDYSFKFVTRYDRCTTCHLGMEKPTLRQGDPEPSLTTDPAEDPVLSADLENATATIDERNKVIADYNSQVSSKDRKDPLPITPTDLQPEPVSKLTAGPDQPVRRPPAARPVRRREQPAPGREIRLLRLPRRPGQRHRFRQRRPFAERPAPARAVAEGQRLGADPLLGLPDAPAAVRRIRLREMPSPNHRPDPRRQPGRGAEAGRGVQPGSRTRLLRLPRVRRHEEGPAVGPDLRLEPDPPLDAMSPEERAKRTQRPGQPAGHDAQGRSESGPDRGKDQRGVGAAMDQIAAVVPARNQDAALLRPAEQHRRRRCRRSRRSSRTPRSTRSRTTCSRPARTCSRTFTITVRTTRTSARPTPKLADEPDGKDWRRRA